MTKHAKTTRDHQVGDVLRVTVYGWVIHEGILTAEGTVISNSRRNGSVVEESVRSFANGRKVTNIGPLSETSPHVAIAHARTRLGQKYSLLSDNCQHFVRHCYKVKPTSPQRNVALVAGAVVASLIVIL